MTRKELEERLAYYEDCDSELCRELSELTLQLQDQEFLDNADEQDYYVVKERIAKLKASRERTLDEIRSMERALNV